MPGASTVNITRGHDVDVRGRLPGFYVRPPRPKSGHVTRHDSSQYDVHISKGEEVLGYGTCINLVFRLERLLQECTTFVDFDGLNRVLHGGMVSKARKSKKEKSNKKIFIRHQKQSPIVAPVAARVVIRFF